MCVSVGGCISEYRRADGEEQHSMQGEANVCSKLEDYFDEHKLFHRAGQAAPGFLCSTG